MANCDRPLIGVTGPDQGGWPAWFMTKTAIWRAGGRAKRITPRRPCSIEGLDGLIIGGGADVNPALYQEEPMIPQIRREGKKTHSSIVDFVFLVALWLLRKLFSSPWHVTEDHARDSLESCLIASAMERGLPILGICRGMQLLNVQFGGSLHQEIADYYEECPQLRTHLPKKKIEIEPSSRLHTILGCTLARVNSLHHQSVKRLGKGLCISALEPNGIVQAIESRHHPFVMGVQWHPEFLPQLKRHQRLFSELVKVATVTKMVQVSPTLHLAVPAEKERTRQISN